MPLNLAQRLAQISLPDSEGRKVRLGFLWAEEAAVVVFLRHYGWIFCREHVAQLREHETEFRAAGATLAAIGLGDPEYARAFRNETGIGFPLLLDDRREAYKAAGLRQASILHTLRPSNFAARARAKAAGHRQHKLGKNPFQLGGSFVFGPGNVDRFVPVSQTFSERFGGRSVGCGPRLSINRRTAVPTPDGSGLLQRPRPW
jgi:peroxiredoxin